MAAAAVTLGITGAQALGGLLSSIFHRGHADDQAGEADGVIMGKVVSPVIAAIIGRAVGTTWMEVDPATDKVAALAAGDWPLTSTQTQALLDAGQAAIDQGCVQLGQAGYPCHEYVPGKSGAGTLAFTKWNRLKGFMLQGLTNALNREARNGTPPAAVNPGSISFLANASTGLAAQLIPSNGVGGGSPSVPSGTIFGIPANTSSSTVFFFFAALAAAVLVLVILFRR